MSLLIPLWVFGLWSLLVGGSGSILGYQIAVRAYGEGYDQGIADASDEAEPEPFVPTIPTSGT